MNILYKSDVGHISMYLILYALIFLYFALGFVYIIYSIIKEDTYRIAFSISLFLLIGSIFYILEPSFRDTKCTIVKALVNDEVTWKEINNKYELISQEGDIYIFKVKEQANDKP